METPEVGKECCLCPVKGGALEPTDIDALWVHVTCAWFRPEFAFLDPEKMESTVGLLKIPPNSFTKIAADEDVGVPATVLASCEE
ncbi:Histone-lysine N-methyltransferase atx3 [Castilleja foliolosa]|uniref:Histone-lysine N-methyltransferase atx3 n=1 Tax=Castilleja foliolosa TaxID=1961234 RepID=A0ABD3D3I2_9LAMI